MGSGPIETVTQLSSEYFLIHYLDKTIQIWKKNEDGKWQLERPIINVRDSATGQWKEEYLKTDTKIASFFIDNNRFGGKGLYFIEPIGYWNILSTKRIPTSNQRDGDHRDWASDSILSGKPDGIELDNGDVVSNVGVVWRFISDTNLWEKVQTLFPPSMSKPISLKKLSSGDLAFCFEYKYDDENKDIKIEMWRYNAESTMLDFVGQSSLISQLRTLLWSNDVFGANTCTKLNPTCCVSCHADGRIIVWRFNSEAIEWEPYPLADFSTYSGAIKISDESFVTWRPGSSAVIVWQEKLNDPSRPI